MTEVIKRVEVDMIGFDVGNDPAKQGAIEIRWRKMLWVDGDLVRAEYHRDRIDPLTNIDARLEEVNADFQEQGYGHMPASDISLIKLQASAIWTPDIVTATKAAREADAGGAKAVRGDVAGSPT